MSLLATELLRHHYRSVKTYLEKCNFKPEHYLAIANLLEGNQHQQTILELKPIFPLLSLDPRIQKITRYVLCRFLLETTLGSRAILADLLNGTDQLELVSKSLPELNIALWLGLIHLLPMKSNYTHIILRDFQIRRFGINLWQRFWQQHNSSVRKLTLCALDFTDCTSDYLSPIIQLIKRHPVTQVSLVAKTLSSLNNNLQIFLFQQLIDCAITCLDFSSTDLRNIYRYSATLLYLIKKVTELRLNNCHLNCLPESNLKSLFETIHAPDSNVTLLQLDENNLVALPAQSWLALWTGISALKTLSIRTNHLNKATETQWQIVLTSLVKSKLSTLLWSNNRLDSLTLGTSEVSPLSQRQFWENFCAILTSAGCLLEFDVIPTIADVFFTRLKHNQILINSASNGGSLVASSVTPPSVNDQQKVKAECQTPFYYDDRLDVTTLEQDFRLQPPTCLLNTSSLYFIDHEASLQSVDSRKKITALLDNPQIELDQADDIVKDLQLLLINGNNETRELTRYALSLTVLRMDVRGKVIVQRILTMDTDRVELAKFCSLEGEDVVSNSNLWLPLCTAIAASKRTSLSLQNFDLSRLAKQPTQFQLLLDCIASSGFSHIDFQHSNLDDLSMDEFNHVCLALKGSKIVCLNLAHNFLQRTVSRWQNIIDSVLTKLTHLSLAHIPLNIVDTICIDPLSALIRKLQYLDLTSTHFHRLKWPAFVKLNAAIRESVIQELILDDNHLDKLTDSFLAELLSTVIQLQPKRLSLNGNKLTNQLYTWKKVFQSKIRSICLKDTALSSQDYALLFELIANNLYLINLVGLESHPDHARLYLYLQRNQCYCNEVKIAADMSSVRDTYPSTDQLIPDFNMTIYRSNHQSAHNSPSRFFYQPASRLDIQSVQADSSSHSPRPHP